MKTIYDICLNIQSSFFNVAYNGNILINGELFKNTLLQFFKSWYCLAENENEFITLLNDYNLLYSFNLSKALDAFKKEYNPIENYDSNIIESWEYGKKVEKNTIGATNTTNTTQPTTFTSTNSITTADNVDTFKNKDKNITENSLISSNIVSNERIDKKEEDARIDTRTFRQSGNIGVTTSQQMIESTLVLYEKNPILDYIKKFAYLYCYMVEVE